MLTLSGLVKRYGTTVAVDGLTLEVAPGEVLGLLGPNGAGKSTTVHLAVGLLSPDAGRVEIAGLGAPTRPGVRQRIGVAPQALSLYDLLTAEENLRFFGRLYGLAGPTLAARVTSALDFVGLVERRATPVAACSGGMQRRLNLAAAKTIVYTTHYLEEAERLCDRIAIIDHGRLLALDTVRGLLATYAGPPTLVVRRPAGDLRLQTMDPLRELNRLAAEAGPGAPPLDFQVVPPTLESVFLHLTGRSLRD
jgi:ABC-2 type transport system ATP-binding protein